LTKFLNADREAIAIMASMRFAAYIAIFNAVMAFFLFLASQFVLFILKGTIVQNVGIYIDYGFPSTPEGPIPTIHAPLPNYPLFVFILTLIGNTILIVLLRKENSRINSPKTSS
jgi:hypothetical protein